MINIRYDNVVVIIVIVVAITCIYNNRLGVFLFLDKKCHHISKTEIKQNLAQWPKYYKKVELKTIHTDTKKRWTDRQKTKPKKNFENNCHMKYKNSTLTRGSRNYIMTKKTLFDNIFFFGHKILKIKNNTALH